MSCCCSNTLNLCRVNACGPTIVTGLTALVEGDYKLILDYLGLQLTHVQTFEIGNPINFIPVGLNEEYVYKGQVFAPDGSLLTMNVNDVVYDCLKFETVLNYSLNQPE